MLISFILSVVFLFCICKLTTNLQSTVAGIDRIFCGWGGVVVVVGVD